MIKNYLVEYQNIIDNLDTVTIECIAELLRNSSNIIFAGNGGSYANATHMAGDLMINSSLSGNICAIGDNLVSFSALSNDTSYDKAMARELTRRVKYDLSSVALILLSTSGHSKNIINLAYTGKEYSNITVVSITGSRPSEELKSYTDIHLMLDSTDAGLLESAFDLVGHLLVKQVGNE
jgi:D-sedoheptulose 7-phosphate isomerase